MLDLDTAPGRAAAERAVALAMGWDCTKSPGCTPGGCACGGYGHWSRDGGPMKQWVPPAYLSDDPALNREMLRKLIEHFRDSIVAVSGVGVWYGILAATPIKWRVEADLSGTDMPELLAHGPTEASALVRALVAARVVAVPHGE